MHAVFRIALSVLAVLLVLLIGIYAYLRNADLSVYEAQIEGFLSEKIGHKVDVDGLFELRFGNVTYATAEQITVTNLEWPEASTILSVGHLSVSVELWSLLKGPIVIQELDVQHVTVHLERDGKNQGNWETAGAAEDTQPKGSFDAGNFIAFRKLRIRDVQLDYVDIDRDKPLHINLSYLTINPDATNVLDLDLRATVNQMPLWAEGKLGPWTNLIDGKEVSAVLDLFLGESSLSVDGYIGDLFSLEGIETSLELRGPAIDRVINALGMPPFADGEFEINASIDAQDTGTLINFDGKLGEITIFANGNIDNFVNPARAEFDFNFAGPDAKYVAEVFGLENVTQYPFQVSGQFAMNGRRYALSNTEAHFATGDLGIDGWIDLTQPIPDGDIRISSSGPDLPVVGAFSGMRGIPADAFALQGHIRKIGATWRFDDFNFQVGTNRIGVSGELDSSNAEVDQIDVTASGPDISILQDMTGLQGIPARPYDVSVRLIPDAAGLRLENAVGVFGDNRLEIEGVLGIRDRLAGTNLSIRASGPELHNVALLIGVPYLPTGAFEFAGRALIGNDTLTIENATAAVTGIDATADGTIGLGPAAGEFDIQLSATGSDFAGLAEFDFIEQFSGESFDVSGRIGRESSIFVLDSVSASVGSLRATIDGEFASDGTAFNFALRADAPDAGVLDNLARIKQLPAGPVVVRGRVQKIGDDLEFTETEFRIGDYRFSADGTLSNSPLSNDSDLHFAASGPDLRQLGLAFGYDRLPSKTYTLSAEINGVATGFAIENLVASIGENEIVGKFSADLRGKPEISGSISSAYIDLESEMLQSSAATDEETDDDREFLFSDEPLGNSWLHAANFDVDVTAGRAIFRLADVHDVHIHLRLRDGRLEIDPFTFRDQGGSAAVQLHIQSLDDGYSLDSSFTIDNMHWGFKTSSDQDRSTLPPLTGHFEISGTGKSWHDLLASSNGELESWHGRGQIQRTFAAQLFGDLVTEVVRTINPLSKSQTHTNLECGIYSVEIIDGIATISDVVMQSDRLTVIASGVVDFNNESINITLRSKPREGFGISLGGVANSFLKLGGTLQNPRLNIDAASSVATTGAAVATGGLSLIARGLWDRVTAQTDLCAKQNDEDK